jgi:hypothetical protein
LKDGIHCNLKPWKPTVTPYKDVHPYYSLQEHRKRNSSEYIGSLATQFVRSRNWFTPVWVPIRTIYRRHDLPLPFQIECRSHSWVSFLHQMGNSASAYFEQADEVPYRGDSTSHFLSYPGGCALKAASTFA